MAVNPAPLTDPDGRLACGRDAAPVWDRAACGRGPRRARARVPALPCRRGRRRGLDALVHRMADERPQPPPSVLDTVMVAVRTELRPHDVLTLPSPYGPARLSRAAAAAVLRHTVDAMEGVRARSCRIEQVTDASSGGPGHAADVRITVTARFGVDLASVTARVRQMVAAAGEQALGMPVRRVDIEVVDVFGGGW